MAKQSSWQLNVFLIRRDLREAEQIFDDIGSLETREITLQDATRRIPAVLYFQPRPLRLPPWASFFQGLFNINELPKVTSIPAVLLVPVDEQILAVAWSYGSGLFKAGSYDPTFGLRVALNSVSRVRVRSYDKRRFDALFRQTREQSAREAKLEDFGIDAERDVIRKLAGNPADKTLGTSMSGGAALSVAARFKHKEFVHYLRRIYRQSTRSFIDEYPWLGRIEEMIDSEIVETLDSYLDDALEDGSAQIWMSVPEIIDWSATRGFRFILPTRSTTVFPDIDIIYLLQALDRAGKISVELLKSKNVEMLDEDDHCIKRWRLFNCINVELVVDAEAYVLSSGTWYKVDSDLTTEVDRQFDTLPRASLDLPPYDIKDEGEFEYNQRVAREAPSRFCCLDRDLIRFGGGRNSFELCDLITNDGDLVHVKRYGGSSVLSHLFAQGSISAELLMKRKSFRKNADGLVESKGFRIPPQKSFGGKNRRQLTYAIIGSEEYLPLFSKINLQNAVRGLSSYDWETQLQFVPVTEAYRNFRRRKGH